MPTQLQAWRLAWAHVGDEVRHGILSHAGTPTRKVRQTLFNTLFPELDTSLRSPRYQASQISETQADLIAAATRDHLGELRALTLIADFVRRWVAATPELAGGPAAAKNAADLWAPRVQQMVEDAGGVAPLAAQGEGGWEAWLRLYDHVDETSPRDLPADGRAIRKYFRQPDVVAHVEEQVADVWARRPAEIRTGRPEREYLGHLPWRIPAGEARREIDRRADLLLDRWPHDALCRVLGLTRVEADAATLAPPPVSRPQDAVEPVSTPRSIDEAWESDDAGEDEQRGIEAPLDRSLLLRLVHRNRRAPITQGRPVRVHELVSEEIDRCAAPLGLLGHDARRALVAAVMTMTYPVWSSKHDAVPPTTENHPDRDLLRIGTLIREAFKGRHLEELPQNTQRRLFQPADTFGPRVWSRLHNWERDRREDDPYRAVASAWSSWLKDLVSQYAPSPDYVPLENLPGAPGIDGAPSGPRAGTPQAPYVRGEEVATALRHLSETVPDDVRAFVLDYAVGFATAAEWHQLTEAAEGAAPGIIDPWPAFDAVRDYLNELRWDLP